MKNLLMILMIAIGVSSVAFGQTKMSNDSKVEAQIIALEKAGWEAWKNNDASWFQANLAEDLVQVNSDGVYTKAQIVKATATECNVKSFSLDNFKFVMLGKDVALLNYTAMQDAVCNGKKIAPQVHATANYVKRDGKWLTAMYMETPMAQNNMSSDMNNSSDGATEQAIVASERAIWKTLTDGKFDDFAIRLAEDYQGFYADKTTNKASEVADVKQLKFKKADPSNFKVQMLDKDNAIVMYEVSSNVTTPDGKDISSNTRVTSAYVKRGGKWMVAHHTNFKIEK